VRKRVSMNQVAETVLLAMMWIAQSASLVLLNKYILVVLGFKHVYTLALSHMATTSILSSVVMSVPMMTDYKVSAEEVSARAHGKLIILGLAFAASLVLASQALIYMDVPSVQMTKTLSPALMYAGALASGLDNFSIPSMVSVAVVCGGVAISLLGAANFTPAGVAFQLASIALDCFRLVWLQIIMQQDDLRLDAFTTLALLAPYAAMMLWCLASWFELAAISTKYAHDHSIAVSILASSILAFLLNWTSFAFIRATSAMNVSLTGVVKDLVLIFVGARLFGTSVTVTQLIGYAVAVVGVLAYHDLKRQGKELRALK